MAWNGLAAASQPVGACSIMVPVQPKLGVTPLARINDVPQPKMSACANVTATKDVCLVREGYSRLATCSFAFLDLTIRGWPLFHSPASADELLLLLRKGP